MGPWHAIFSHIQLLLADVFLLKFELPGSPAQGTGQSVERVLRIERQGGIHAFANNEKARVYSLPDELPPIYMAAAGADSATTAAEIADGLISTSPASEIVRAFDKAGGKGKPRIGQVSVCWADNEEEAQRVALHWWPNAALTGELSQELHLPGRFEQAAELVNEEMIGESVICGPDAQRHIHAIQEYVDAGFEQVYVHQIGPTKQASFNSISARFYRTLEHEPMPAAQCVYFLGSF